MKEPVASEERPRRSRWPWLIAAGALLALLIAILLPRSGTLPSQAPGSASAPGHTGSGSDGLPASGSGILSHRHHESGPAPTAEEIVAGKVVQFARSRREIVRAMAAKNKIKVPAELEQFFDAVEAGDWEKTKAIWQSLRPDPKSWRPSEELLQLWCPVMETYGVTETAHEWPAQKLLDYGEAILNSLRPGMAYLGGTDPGRFIPTLLNETTPGEKHIVLTQNGLADGSYLDYVNYLYGGRMTALSQDDSQRTFQDYMLDAQKRLAHDKQFPDEPKQVRRGENISDEDGRLQMSGQTAVMAINENLLKMLMEKNPDLSFALEESLPLKGTYGDASLLGPVMELRSADGQKALTADSAAQAVDYWRSATQQLLADPDTPADSDPRKAYSKLAESQANLLAEHNFNKEAEQTYRLAIQMNPDNHETVQGLAALLTRTGRADEGQRMLDDFKRAHPKPAKKN